MSKPKYLFHGSQNKNIEVFEPRAISIRHKDEGPVVFAAIDEERASKFIVPANDTWSRLGGFNDVNFAIYNDENRFHELDKGGAIYKLSSETFFNETKYGGSKNEWTSKVSVKPLSKKIYESGLEAMLNFGVQVYFVDKKTFREIDNSDDHGWEIIIKLESENRRRNINMKEFK